ncbi:hypothetical protein [Paenibacillus abyssi]|uniref:Uncharacterized protein n=1 Tax=Paenibacillus abyssi TaxID=1340531 RepID=A0A917CPN2_9BACL|nr:hypothetical protein [Paenibacillus abyssi]GGF93007.1 hypothetical protein GCM10010916_07950 [Paenibacillus abyssi]
MAMKKDDRVDDLVTEKDIDPEFGLFTEEPDAAGVPDATEELIERYPSETVLRVEEDPILEEPEDRIIDPVDPAAPQEEFHGTDLLNGVGNRPYEETE